MSCSSHTAASYYLPPPPLHVVTTAGSYFGAASRTHLQGQNVFGLMSCREPASRT